MVSPHEHTEIERKLDECRKRLVGTETRNNRLLHVERYRFRGKCIDIINERSDDVFEILRKNSKTMRFLATGNETTHTSESFDMMPDLPLPPIEESRYTDLFLETPLTPQNLEKKLLQLEIEARSIEEETGLSCLFLAIGFLRWIEKDTNKARQAPLVLVPVTLERERKKFTICLRCREDEITVNWPLQERLKTDFNMDLPDIDENDDWKPSLYYEQVRACIGNKVGWSIDENGMLK